MRSLTIALLVTFVAGLAPGTLAEPSEAPAAESSHPCGSSGLPVDTNCDFFLGYRCAVWTWWIPPWDRPGGSCWLV